METVEMDMQENTKLWINELPVPGTLGVIGMTICPGKKGRGAYALHDRDLSLDLDVVREWGAHAVVTLMEHEELVDYQVAELGGQVRARGMAWFHLPIRDMGVPGEEFENQWQTEGMRLRSLLRDGKKVMIHCLGGLGRTGTIAGRILVELGTVPQEAVLLVREARKGTIQTGQQEAHVLNSCPVLLDRDERHARILACLLGGALGDALGYRVEFNTLDSICARFGPEGVTEPAMDGEIGIVSDDTQMTLFALEGMLRARHGSMEERLESLRVAWLDWYATQQPGTNKHRYHGNLGQEPVLWQCRAPGIGTLEALRGGGQGTLDEPENENKGCGAVMRVAPIGFFPGWLDEEQTFVLAMRSAALTHGHRSAALAAGAMALMIRRLLLGEPLAETARAALDRVRRESGHDEVERAMERALKASERDDGNHAEVINGLWGDPSIAQEGSRGWVAEEALAIGLYAALKGNDLMEVIRIAANHSGDSDSTASIAGQLHGAWKGTASILSTMMHRVDTQSLIERLAIEVV